MTQEQEERRNFTRIPFGALVKLSQADKQLETQLIDISLNGVLVNTPNDYALMTDEPVNIHIELSDNTVITMQTTLAHSSNVYLGFKCDSIDMESITHLRRIVELNIGGKNASERVLSELMSCA